MVWHCIGVYVITRILHGRLRFLFSSWKKYFTRSLSSLVKYFSTLEEKFRISAQPCNILYLFFSKLASGPNPPKPAIWLVPRAGGFLRSCPGRIKVIRPGHNQIFSDGWFTKFCYTLCSASLTRAESLAASFTSLFVVWEWAKPVIFNHVSFKTCAIISVS